MEVFEGKGQVVHLLWDSIHQQVLRLDVAIYFRKGVAVFEAEGQVVHLLWDSSNQHVFRLDVAMYFRQAVKVLEGEGQVVHLLLLLTSMFSGTYNSVTAPSLPAEGFCSHPRGHRHRVWRYLRAKARDSTHQLVLRLDVAMHFRQGVEVLEGGNQVYRRHYSPGSSQGLMSRCTTDKE